MNEVSRVPSIMKLGRSGTGEAIKGLVARIIVSLDGILTGIMASLIVTLLPNAAFAQSATPGSIVVLDTLVVTGRPGANAEVLVRDKLEAIPGGTGLEQFSC